MRLCISEKYWETVSTNGHFYFSPCYWEDEAPLWGDIQYYW